MYCTKRQHIHVDVDNDTIPAHKHILIEFVNSLIRQGNTETMLPLSHEVLLHIKTRIQQLYTDGQLVSLHELVPTGKQSKCKYCQYLVLVFKN